MTYLGQFTEDQRDLLVSLPYRTGLWVSESDDAGGLEADVAEREALESIITGFSEDFCKSEFVEELMKEMVARRDRWNDWRRDVDSVPRECRRAIEILAERMDGRDVSSFKRNLMDIATTVALAYREMDRMDVPMLFEVYGRWLAGKVAAAVRGTRALTVGEIMNISRTERTALKELAEVLRPDRKEGLAGT